jgi:Ca2+-binding EF-hand superfamily protein
VVAGAGKIMSLYDLDKDGVLKSGETENLVADLLGYAGLRVTSELVRLLCLEFDKDEDGRVSLKDLQSVL